MKKQCSPGSCWWWLMMWLTGVTFSAGAQSVSAPVIQWQRVVAATRPVSRAYPDFTGPDIVENSRGGYDVVTADRRLLRVSPAGAIRADTLISGLLANGRTTPSLQIRGLAPTPDGGVLLGVKDALGWSVQRRDASGAIAWIYRFGIDDSPSYFYGITNILLQPDGNIVVVGMITYRPGRGTHRVVVSKISRNGVAADRVTTISYNYANFNTAVEQALATPDGGYLLAGGISSFPNYDVQQGWLAKLDSQGHEVWQKAYPERQNLNAIVASPYIDGSYIAAGINDMNPEISNTLIIDAAGNPVGGFKQPGHQPNTPLSLVTGQTVTGKSALYVVLDQAKQNGGDFRFTAVTQSDQLVWTKTLGGSGADAPQRIMATNDGGYVVVGTTTSTDGDIYGKTTTDLATWIVKLIPAVSDSTPELTVLVMGNPAGNKLKVEVRGALGQTLTLRLVDAVGRLVESRRVDAADAVEQQTFDIGWREAGLLYLRASNDSQSQTVRIIK